MTSSVEIDVQVEAIFLTRELECAFARQEQEMALATDFGLFQLMNSLFMNILNTHDVTMYNDSYLLMTSYRTTDRLFGS